MYPYSRNVLRKTFMLGVLSSRVALSSTPIRQILSGCCACALIGHAAATPNSVMNARRLMPNIGLPPSALPVCRTLNLLQGGRKVLGPDLNCSESTWGAADLLPCCHPNNSTHDAPVSPPGSALGAHP